MVYYYLEAYNLLKNTSPNYFTKVTVTNSLGREVITRARVKNRVNESNVEVGALQINTLRTGAYTFNFSIIDSVDNSNYTSSKRLFIYNPQLPLDSLTTGTEGSVLASEYAAMTEDELDLEFAQLRYISTRAEQAQYKSVKGVDAKRKLLTIFGIGVVRIKRIQIQPRKPSISNVLTMPTSILRPASKTDGRLIAAECLSFTALRMKSNGTRTK